MIKETNLIDISKMTSENYNSYNEKIKYEIPRQYNIRQKTKKVTKTKEEREQHLKEYQHNYYLNVIKMKRKLAKEDKQ